MGDDAESGILFTADNKTLTGLLAHGDVSGAGDLMGHPPVVRGMVVHGAARGRELGYPTANLSTEAEGIIPADGIYAGWLKVDESTYPAAISVGTNPTFDGIMPRQVEAYVLDETLDLYDRVVEVSFVAHVRDQVRFTEVEALITQITADVAVVRSLLLGNERTH